MKIETRQTVIFEDENEVYNLHSALRHYLDLHKERNYLFDTDRKLNIEKIVEHLNKYNGCSVINFPYEE